MDQQATDPAARAMPILPNLYRTTLVREPSGDYDAADVSTPENIAKLVTPFLSQEPVEHFLVLLLNTKNRLIGSVDVSKGDLANSIVHPREVFAPAIVARASSIIAIHNHPSGDPTPSRRDVEVTKRIQEAGDLLGISLLDHVIVTENPARFYSFQQHGFLGGMPVFVAHSNPRSP